MHFLGWIIRTNDKRRQFVSAVCTALRARKMARNMLSDQEISTKEEMLFKQRLQLNQRAQSLIEESGASEGLLRVIFDEVKDIDRELKQLRIARKLGSERTSTRNSFFLRVMRERNASELRSAQKLLSASGMSERQLQRCEGKLQLLSEQEQDEEEQESEAGSGETEFSAWIESLKKSSSLSKLKCLAERSPTPPQTRSPSPPPPPPSVSYLEGRLQALKHQ